jgi:hypothetical protein
MIRAVADEFVEAACAVRSDCTHDLIVAGDALSTAGTWMDAVSCCERAAQKTPGFHVLMKLAGAAGRAERPALAEASLRRAERYVGNDPRLLKRLEFVRGEARQRSLRSRSETR